MGITGVIGIIIMVGAVISVVVKEIRRKNDSKKSKEDIKKY